MSGQRGHGGATSTAGGHTAYGVLLRPSGNEFTTGWGGFGSTWLRGGPSGPWRTSTVAPTRCWSGPTRLGRSRWARRWRSSAGTASSHTWAVWILWLPGCPHVGGRGSSVASPASERKRTRCPTLQISFKYLFGIRCFFFLTAVLNIKIELRVC